MRWTITLAVAALVFASVGIVSAEKHDGVNPVMLNMKENPTKVFPLELVRKRVSGAVLLRFRLDENGQPQDAMVLRAEPKEAYETTALEFISKARFSVPPEWITSHPTRVLDMGMVFLVAQCLVKDVFPGILSAQFMAWPELSKADTEKSLRECEAQRALRSTIDRPTQ